MPRSSTHPLRLNNRTTMLIIINLLNFFPVWTTVHFLVRKIFGIGYFSSYPLGCLMLLVSAVATWWLSAQIAPVFKPQRRQPLGKWGWLLIAALIAYILYFLIASYSNYFVSSIEIHAKTGFYGDGRDDVHHISISNFLTTHAVLDSNPFYSDGKVLYHFLYDLLVTILSQITCLNLIQTTYLLLPLVTWPLLALVFFLLGDFIRHYRVLCISLLCCSYFAVIKYDIVSSYNLMGLAYSVYFLVIGIKALRILRKGVSSQTILAIGILIWTLAHWISGIKMFFFLSVGGAVGLMAAFAVLRAWYSNRRVRIEAMRPFAGICLPILLVLVVLTFQVKKFNISLYSPCPECLVESLGKLLTFWRLEFLAFIGFWMATFYVILGRARRFSESLFFITACLLAVLISYLQRNTITQGSNIEGGALEFYPFYMLSSLTLVISSFFLLQVGRYQNFLKKRRAQMLFLCLAVLLWEKIFSLYIPVNTALPKPYQAFDPSRYSSPNKEALEIVDFLNQRDLSARVITNYWSINRNYSLTMFMKPVPFMAHPANLFGFYQTDFQTRGRLLTEFFLQRKADSFFRELKEKYPRVKYILIDNSLLQTAYPGETTPLIWENHIFTDAPDPLKHIAKQQKMNREIRKISDTDFSVHYSEAEKHTIYVHQVSKLFAECIRNRQLILLKQNDSASLYEIQ